MSADTYHVLLKVHWLSVLAFLLIYLYKLVLLTTNKIGNLEHFSKKFKIPEIAISVLFLLTGIILLINTGNTSHFLWIKIGLVFAAIPIGIIGFKKHNKILAALCIVLVIASYGMAEVNKNISKKELKVVLQHVPTPNIEPNTNKDTLQSDLVQKQLVEYGKQLYTAACTNCHGENGELGKSGAKNLKTSTLSEAEKKHIILNGKGVMPAYRSLSEVQVQSILEYIKTFKK
ncbi:MAG: cytochrome c [Bacteroidia bacterium]|nr:cytochrome c [Bacteroidia bacterium]MDW8302160.1 cytochrome c [Bacteroidia bacterium]